MPIATEGIIPRGLKGKAWAMPSYAAAGIVFHMMCRRLEKELEHCSFSRGRFDGVPVFSIVWDENFPHDSTEFVEWYAVKIANGKQLDGAATKTILYMEHRTTEPWLKHQKQEESNG